MHATPFQTHFAKKESLRLFDFLLLQHDIVVPAPTRGSFVRVERNASSRISWSPVVLCVTFVGVDYGTWYSTFQPREKNPVSALGGSMLCIRSL